MKEENQLVYELLCKQFQVAFGVDSLADLRKVDTVALRQADFDRQIFELQEEKRKLYESLVSGGIPLPKYKEQKEQISERLLEVQNTKAVVMARLEAEQEERQHQRQQIDISRMLTESNGLSLELVDLLIDKIYVYPDKRVDVEFKIRDSLAASGAAVRQECHLGGTQEGIGAASGRTEKGTAEITAEPAITQKTEDRNL